jgi:Lysylphosphatidylglycerol synthase TM region
VSALAARHFASTGWPLQHADPILATGAGLLIVLSYPLKALGWQRVFRPSDRPGAMSLAAANGAASVTGAALPGRMDEVVRIAVIRRYPSCPACVPTLALSLFVVGLIDAAALMPIGAAAAATSSGPPAVQAGLSVVAATGLAAGLIVLLLPRLMASGRLIRFRVARWIRVRLISQHDAWQAWLLVLASWVLRATGLYLMLAAMGLSLSFPLAIGFLCAAAAASALPIAPAAGAAAQAGGGAAMLVTSGISTQTAIDFAVSAQALVIFAGAAVLIFAALWHSGERVSARLRAS